MEYYPGAHARRWPDKAAAIDASSGEVLSYRQLDERSTQLARALRTEGLERGGHVALLMENRLDFFVVAWAAFRSGLYVTAINRYLTAPEVAYIIDNCEAQAIVTSDVMADVATEALELNHRCDLRLCVGDPREGYESFEERIALESIVPLDEQPIGDSMLYSSGTTGRPKGIKRPLPDDGVEGGIRTTERMLGYGFDENSIYLSPAPLYHAAPFAYTMGVLSVGGTIVMMRKFAPLESLKLIEEHRVTHSQWVPTHFVRMLKLDLEERTAFDLSTHQLAIHAAAPCPVPVKQKMIEWWGPIVFEYYAGTEGNGSTNVTSEEWLERPGTVGQAKHGILHICDEEGRELEPREEGLIFFEQEEMPFEYHGDTEKTRNAQHPIHPNWSTLGDIGYVDEEGYLFLTDRKAFTIISGGVNIYPREIEDVLIVHPDVVDVGVFGVPDNDFGESVMAVVQLRDGVLADAATRDALLAHAREQLAGFKVPRRLEFQDELPRLPTGKLYKRKLMSRYAD